MTKTATPTESSPLQTAIGQDILAEDLLAIAQAIHWAFINRRECHLAMATGSVGWDDYPGAACATAPDGNAVPALSLIATGSAVTHIDTDLWIDADTAALGSLELGAQARVTTAANTLRVSFILTGGLGTSTDTIDFTTANSLPAVDQEVSTTRTLSAVTAGGEWVRLSIQVQRTAGAATDNELRHVRVQETELAIGSVPDPQDS